MAAGEENIRVRIPTPLKEKWDAAMDGRKISTQRALAEMMRWMIEQDPLTQAMIFGQVPETDRVELSQIVLNRLAAGRKKKAG